MATRRLPRTIIEGGRSSGYKTDVRATNRSERRSVKNFCNKSRFDADLPDEEVDERNPVPTWGAEKFNDRLAVALRWLKSNQDRPWAEVYSELRQMADVRTLKGWHFLDHVNKAIFHFGFPIWKTNPDGSFVDADGILRYKERPTWRLRVNAEKPKKPAWSQRNWENDPELIGMFHLGKIIRFTKLNFGPKIRETSTIVIGRLVIEVGEAKFWAENVTTATAATRLGVPRCHWCRCDLIRDYGTKMCAHGSWRQTVRLTPTELALWQDLPEYIKKPLRWSSWKDKSKLLLVLP